MRKIMIPIIRNLAPGALAADLLSVQPMTSETGEIFRMQTSVGHGDGVEYPRGTHLERHVFGRGWEILWHGQWIPQDVWWKLKIKGIK